jgi:ribosomal protein L11 methyltransferase
MAQASPYTLLDFTLSPLDPFRDILLAELVELGFDSFEETSTGLKAYAIQEQLAADWWDAVQLRHMEGVEITFTKEEVPDINWNAEWEKQFEPIELGHRCRVRADFHPFKEVEHDLIISPKMSFGTGHHQTTFMMLEFLLEAELTGAAVLDMGCGTGVLAILAEQRGAVGIKAVDIDHWAVENAKENILLNKAKSIEVKQGDMQILHSWPNQFQWVIANINRNILLQDIPEYVRCLKEEGVLLLSGFYTEDLPLIDQSCAALGGRLEKKRERDNWVAAKYVF